MIIGAIAAQKAPARKAARSDAPPAPLRRGRGALTNASGRFEAERRQREDDGWASQDDTAAAAHDGDGGARRAPSSPATIRPTFRSTARSIPIAAASMAASIASRGRPTPISACRPASISRPSCSPSPMPPTLLDAELREAGLSLPADRARHQHRSLSADRAQASGSRAQILEVLSALQPSGRHRHQIGAGPARPRHPGADGGARARSRSALSVTTLDRDLARSMEPRASDPGAPARGDPALAEAGMPVGVHGRADDPGAQRLTRWRRSWRRRQRRARASAGYMVLRLPLEIKRSVHRMAGGALCRRGPAMCCRLVRSTRDGKLYDFNLRQADDGCGAVRLDDRPPLRGRSGSARPRQKPHSAAQRFVHPPGPCRSNCSCFRRPTSSAPFLGRGDGLNQQHGFHA